MAVRRDTWRLAIATLIRRLLPRLKMPAVSIVTDHTLHLLLSTAGGGDVAEDGRWRPTLFCIRCLERHHVGIVVVLLVQEAAADKNASSSLLPMHLLALGLQMIK